MRNLQIVAYQSSTAWNLLAIYETAKTTSVKFWKEKQYWRLFYLKQTRFTTFNFSIDAHHILSRTIFHFKFVKGHLLWKMLTDVKTFYQWNVSCYYHLRYKITRSPMCFLCYIWISVIIYLTNNLRSLLWFLKNNL